MLSSMKAFVAHACVAASLAAAVAGAAPSVVFAQDQEAGDVRVDLPPRRKLAEPEPEHRTRASVGTPGPLRIYGGFSLAVGGDRQYVVPSNGFYNSYGARSLDPTVGLQAGADYVVMDYFSIGGETRFLWTKTAGQSIGRDFLWDLDVKPRGRYAFHNIPLEVYGALPVGLTVAGLKGEPSGKPGFNIGIVGGANYWFTSHIAINAELGWVFHKYGETIGGGPRIDMKMNQFLLLCPNFVYSL